MHAKLLVIDDHPLFVDGFAMMMQHARPDWAVISAFHATEALTVMAAHTDFDLIIIDIQLPDHDGFETFAMIAALHPQAPRLIISGREDALAQLRAKQMGAKGFIVKSAPADEILRGIDSVMRGEACFSNAAADPDAVVRLTPRQIDVLGLLASGCANKEIRYRLNIAERTVRAHLTELFGILGVNSRVQAILRAREMGLIE